MTPEEAVARVRAGARIRELREASGLTQQALADKLGCSQPHIANIERGHSPLSDQYRDALAALLGERVA